METYVWIIIAAVIVLVGFAISLLVTGRIVFWNTLTRKNKNMWSRNVSFPGEEHHKMYYDGVAYMEQFADKKIDLHTMNDGLNLYAEYYDFGYDRAVILIPGRSEGLKYGYYFVKAYIESGYNVLTIDQRAHGLSDGKYNSFGFDESKDIIKWGEILHGEYGVKSIVIHGICVGCACAVYALTSDNCPDYFTAFVAEGMYANFFLSFKNHMKAFHAPSFVVIDVVNMLAKRFTGYTMKIGPIDYIHKYKKPLLMLHGDADIYSVPKKAEELFAKAGTDEANKRLVWFDKGRHSRLRLQHTEQYDNAIKSFLTEVVDRQTADK